jgi:hypothetical protein
MRTYLIDFIDQFGYPDDTIVKAYSEREARVLFYQEFPSGCRIKSIN